jgi:glyoxylase-like metal-dependent hydrolase (beta-lactamase superfamily II)
MPVRHLNCATLCPWSARLINGRGGLLSPARLVCHCLLIEGDQGFALVDTGLGLADVAEGRRRLGTYWVVLSRPRLDPEETAARQIQRLGIGLDDVRHIVLTHLDLDHAGGISDFPRATVHVFEDEYQAATQPTTSSERRRYVRAQWGHARWKLHALAGQRWMGFPCVQALVSGLDLEVLLVPLVGHTRGHCGVALRTEDGWLLHCGDSYFFHDEMARSQPSCTLGLRILQRSVEVSRAARLANQARLRDLVREHSEVRLFCSHDPAEMP